MGSGNFIYVPKSRIHCGYFYACSLGAFSLSSHHTRPTQRFASFDWTDDCRGKVC